MKKFPAANCTVRERRCPSCGHTFPVQIPTRDSHGHGLLHIVESGSIVPCPKCGVNLSQTSDTSFKSILTALVALLGAFAVTIILFNKLLGATI